MHVRSVQETARLELRSPGSQEALTVCIFPVRIESDAGSLPVPQSASRMEVVAAAADGEVWRFTSSISDAAGSVYVYTSEFDLQPNRPWLRRRCQVRWNGDHRPAPLLRQIVLDETDVGSLNATQPYDGWQSYPILSRSFFWGVEFPAAIGSIKGNIGQLSCRPGVRLQPDSTYEMWPVVYGVSKPGASREAFEAYIDTLRPPSQPVHIQYNSWWSLPLPYTQPMLLDLIGIFEKQFHTACGGHLDSFCLDLGWSDRQSIWQIDRKSFPDGFTPISRALARMGSRLGLWVSPSSMYPQGLDPEWAKSNGYETQIDATRKYRFACLAGHKYREAIKTSLVGLEHDYEIAHFKFDGYVPTCNETDHGHEPGEPSVEPTAMGLIEVFRALRAEDPKVWIEATCFGYRPSPWWLAYTNTLIGTFGDDAPAGRTPCPIYRESYTTARDFFNLQGTRDVLIPVRSQEVLGVIHQTPEPFENDAIVAALRGHAFLPLYNNPKYMYERRWRFLARWSKWVPAHAELLAHTRAITTGLWADTKVSADWNGPVGRDPYGYAHFDRNRGLLLVRNPWILPQSVPLKLDDHLGCAPEFAAASATEIYPLYQALPGELSYGSKLEVALGPYETRVIELGPGSKAPPPDTAPPRLVVHDSTLGHELPKDSFRCSFSVEGGKGSRELLILVEGQAPLAAPDMTVRVNGKNTELNFAESAGAWSASGLANPKAWIWGIATLPDGQTSASFDVQALQAVDVSAYVATRENLTENINGDGPLSPPEFHYLDAAVVMPGTRLDFQHPPNEVNLALATRGARASASSVYGPEYTAERTIDAAPQTRWNSGGGDVNGAWLQVDLPSMVDIRELRFQEAAGGRITEYAFQAWDGREWRDVVRKRKPAKVTQVRHRIEPVHTQRVRLLVITATEVPSIYDIEVFNGSGATTTAPATAGS